MWNECVNASSLEQVLELLAQNPESTRVVAGATDLILEFERGARHGITTLVDITRVPGLNRIWLDEKQCIHIGALATHNDCVASEIVQQYAYPLARACWEVGSPQIRNRGTVAGNLITASPANDTITPLMALGASVTLRSRHGQRVVPLSEFYLGVRRTVLQPGEMLIEILVPAMQANQRGAYVKFALRRAQAISLVNLAVIVAQENEIVTSASMTLGAVAPTIIHAPEAEAFLVGKNLTDEVIQQAAELAMAAAKPISDVRGTAKYRKSIVRVIAKRALTALRAGTERDGFPARAVLLVSPQLPESTPPEHSAGIRTKVNGTWYETTTGREKTLLRFIREDLGLTGSKEGCAEGECGACTVFLDGKAVMSCMVPAARADGAEIVTVEGLSTADGLHPVQQAFIDEGAVQCGYCTPGFLMSAAKLLEETPAPDTDQIRQALTGNLCRCTGYYKIIKAVETAAEKVHHG